MDRRVDEGSRPVYRGLYFNLGRDEDVEILGWLLAIPRSRRMRAIKAVLRTGLPAYAAARDPEMAPLAPDTVRAMLSTPPRARTRSQGVLTAPAFRGNARPAERPPVADPALPGNGRPVDARVVAEAKLDRPPPPVVPPLT
jgi:hypothetical protein